MLYFAGSRATPELLCCCNIAEGRATIPPTGHSYSAPGPTRRAIGNYQVSNLSPRQQKSLTLVTQPSKNIGKWNRNHKIPDISDKLSFCNISDTTRKRLVLEPGHPDSDPELIKKRDRWHSTHKENQKATRQRKGAGGVHETLEYKRAADSENNRTERNIFETTFRCHVVRNVGPSEHGETARCAPRPYQCGPSRSTAEEICHV